MTDNLTKFPRGSLENLTLDQMMDLSFTEPGRIAILEFLQSKMMVETVESPQEVAKDIEKKGKQYSFYLVKLKDGEHRLYFTAKDMEEVMQTHKNIARYKSLGRPAYK